MSLGENLKKLLSEKNMSISELAKCSGIPKTTLYSIISRDSKNLSFDVMIKLSKALNVDFSELLVDKEQISNRIENEKQPYTVDDIMNAIKPAINENFKEFEIKIAKLLLAASGYVVHKKKSAKKSHLYDIIKDGKIIVTITDDELSDLTISSMHYIEIEIYKLIKKYDMKSSEENNQSPPNGGQ